MANEYILKGYLGSSQATTLTNAYTTANVSLTVINGTTFPDGATSGPFVIVISRGLADEEKMLISNNSGNVFTILEKGYDGTTSQNHPAGSTINHCLDAYTLVQTNRYANLQTAKGDLVARSASTTVRLPIGTNNYALVADSLAANGLAWQQIVAGGIATDAVTTAKIQDSAVTSAKIADGTIVNADINASAAIVDTKLATISTASKVSNSATTATNGNTANTIVARDGSGDFQAGVVFTTTNEGQGRGVGICAHAGASGPPAAILQFLNNAGNAQWSALMATNNLLTVSTPIASSSFVGNVTGTAGNVTTAGTTWTPTLGNGTWSHITWTGRYIQVGKMVQFIIFGSAYGACVLGTGYSIPLLNLPVAPASTNAGGGFGTIICDTDGLVEYHGITQIGAASTIRPMVTNTSSTYAKGSQLETNVPMTWESGDYIFIQGTYEAA